MLECKFDLNGNPMSQFIYGSKAIAAFSGRGHNRNLRTSACLANEGPIPPGSYYIVDRRSGGLTGPLRDLFNDKDTWFALYADDGRIDDETFCQTVRRGNFRLHPKGQLGISKGCITIDGIADYQSLWATLRNTRTRPIPNSGIKSLGCVLVK